MCEQLVQSLVILESHAQNAVKKWRLAIFSLPTLVYILIRPIPIMYVNLIAFWEKKLDLFVSVLPKSIGWAVVDAQLTKL
jgi:ABC-type polysaccharide transport system permease subunit